MKCIFLRIFIWLVILVTPTLLWFALTDNGHAAWYQFFGRGSTAMIPVTSHAAASTSGPNRYTGHGIILIPAYAPPTQPELLVRMNGTAGLGLIVTDPKGRRSGIELGSHKALKEIPHSQVRRVLPAQNSVSGQKETILITVLPTHATLYKLAISAHQAGEYRLSIGGVSPSLVSMRTGDYGDIPDETTLHYRVNLDNIVPIPLFLGARQTVQPPPNEAHAFLYQTKPSVIEPTDPKLVAAAAAVDRDPCGYVYRRLKEVSPHQVTRSQGKLTWLGDNKPFSGCQVVLQINKDTPAGGAPMPNFVEPGSSYLYRLGWREYPPLDAGGPNGSELGIDDRTWLCLVDKSWPDSGNSTTMTVQCRERSLKFKH